MPTRLVWPSRVTTGSRRGSVRPPSGISHTCREGASGPGGLPLVSDPVLEPLLAHVPTTTHHDCAILGATGNDIVIVRAPGDVQHGGGVATDRGHILVHTSSLAGTEGLLREVLWPLQSQSNPLHIPSVTEREAAGSLGAEQGARWESLVLCARGQSCQAHAGGPAATGWGRWSRSCLPVRPWPWSCHLYLFLIRALRAHIPTPPSLSEASMAHRLRPFPGTGRGRGFVVLGLGFPGKCV